MRENILMYIFIFIYISPVIFGLAEILIPEDSIPNPFDYARITDVDYQAVLIDEPYSKGKVRITEKLTFDTHAFSKGNLFWELWRALPEKWEDGVKVDYNVISVKELKPNGTSHEYKEADHIYWYDYEYQENPYYWFHSPGPYNPDRDRYECVLMYVNGLYREKVQFEVVYEMNNAALRYGDCSSLYLTMYSESTIKYLNSFKAEILIADEDMPRIGNYKAGTYGTNSHTFRFTESDYKHEGYHTFTMKLDKDDLKFRPYNQYLEFTLLAYGEDKHKFTEYASHNNYYSAPALQEILDEQQEYDELLTNSRDIKTKVLIFSILGSSIVLVSTILVIEKTTKKHKFYRPNINVHFFREIPSDLDPYFAATLVFSKEKKKKELKEIYSALMLSLVRKKYIKLEKKEPHLDWTPKNTIFKVLVAPSNGTNTSNNTISNINTNYYTNILNNFSSTSPTTTQPTSITDRLDQMERKLNGVIDIPVTKKYSNSLGNELEELTPSEEAYLNLIYRYSRIKDLTMHEFQQRVKADCVNTDTFVKKVKRTSSNIGMFNGYYQCIDFDKPKNKLLAAAKKSRNCGLIFLFIVNFISHFTRLDYAYGAFTLIGIACLFKSYRLRAAASKAVLYTQYGEDEYAKWKGLYDFLNSETLMRERTVIELPLWEKYLVYATAFGISEKVSKALALRCSEIEIMSSPMLENKYYRSPSFRTSSRSFSSSVRSASRTYSSYSSGSFSGGRGGGGGGGGH